MIHCSANKNYSWNRVVEAISAQFVGRMDTIGLLANPRYRKEFLRQFFGVTNLLEGRFFGVTSICNLLSKHLVFCFFWKTTTDGEC